MPKYPNLEAEMAKKGVSRKDVAEAVGVSVVSVSKWLNDKSIPSVDKALAVSKMLGSTVDYLFSK